MMYFCFVGSPEEFTRYPALASEKSVSVEDGSRAE